jgi:short-subunit dehydrogenase
MKPLAVITGASSGIGYAFAHVFSSNGYDVVLIARSEDRLLKLKHELEGQFRNQAHILQLDLTHSDASLKIEQFCNQLNRPVDVLVNNAGFGSLGAFVESAWNSQKDMMTLNMLCLTELCHRFSRRMIATGHGRILNVASIAAFQPGPLMAVYYATKSFVLSFSLAFAEELKGTGVTCTALCPGPTESEFGKVSGVDESKLFRSLRLPSSRAVAEFGYKACLRGDSIAIHGVRNQLLAGLQRFVPRQLLLHVVKDLHQKSP